MFNENESEFLEIEALKNMTTNLSGKYAYYMCGKDNFDIYDIFEWLGSVYHNVNSYSNSGFIDWLEGFNNGTLSEGDIDQISEIFIEMNECGSLFTHIIISKENKLSECIEEIKHELKRLALVHEVYNKSNITDEQINNEALCHFYIKIGEYYIFAINLDSPFECYNYLTNKC